MPDRLTSDDVRKVARLAKLALTNEEIERERARLASVLEYMRALDSLPLDGLEPLARPGDADDSAQRTPAGNVLRDDAPGETLPPSTVASLAPDALLLEDASGQMDATTFIRVPRVLNTDGGS